MAAMQKKMLNICFSHALMEVVGLTLNQGTNMATSLLTLSKITHISQALNLQRQ
jgi:hypothetical protein